MPSWTHYSGFQTHYSGFQRASTLALITWLWPLSSTLRKKFIGRNCKKLTLFITIFEVALSYIGAHGLSYWAPPWASPPLLRAFHSRQMDIVGGLFSTCSSTTTGWAGIAGQASHRVCTTCPCTTYAWGHLYCSSYYTSCSTSCTSYIGGLHHHICHRVSCHGAFVLDTKDYT